MLSLSKGLLFSLDNLAQATYIKMAGTCSPLSWMIEKEECVMVTGKKVKRGWKVSHGHGGC